MGNDYWEGKIYMNDEIKTSIKVKNETELKDIRQQLKLLFPNNDNYCFISKTNSIIRNEMNFTAQDVWKDDENNGYRIDLMTPEYYNASQSGLITIYLNSFPTVAVLINKNMSLEEIKILGGNQINRNTVFFLTSDNIIIENINYFKAKDIIVIDKNGKKIINCVDKHFYKRVQVIEHLRKLEQSIGSIDWLKQTEFFKKIKEFAGEEITNAIINDLLENVGNNQKINDREYIKRFLNLLVSKKDNNNNVNRSSLSSGF